MDKGKQIWFLGLAGLITFVLYEVNFVFDVSAAHGTEIPDPVAEAEYLRCYQSMDDDIHTTAFGTIDNPDVQKEFISANRARAVRDCRTLHPQQTITVEEPSRFNIVELEPRYW